MLLLESKVWRNAPVLLYILDILFPICILVHDILELLVPLCILDVLVPDILVPLGFQELL